MGKYIWLLFCLLAALCSCKENHQGAPFIVTETGYCGACTKKYYFEINNNSSITYWTHNNVYKVGDTLK